MKALLIYNPVAGPRNITEDLEQVIAFLRSQDWEIVSRRTWGPGDATTYAREAAAEGYDMAIAVGGDGTLGEMASGLVGSECVAGLLPAGTGNVWAHMVGLPVWSPLNRTALLEAAHTLVNGRVQAIDLGRIRDGCFVLWAGAGFDAQVTHDIEPHREMRRSLGHLGYTVTALALSLSLRGTRVTVRVDGQVVRQRALLILVSNAQLYGRAWRIAPQAQLDDGFFDICIFKGANTLDAFRHLFGILSGQHLKDPKIETYRARHIEIRGDKPLPLHMDGDPAGYTPVRITLLPKALRIIVPTWTSEQLFEGGEAPEQETSLAQRILERLRYERERLREEGERLRQDWGRRLGWPSEEEDAD